MILSACLRRRRGGPVLEYALLVALPAGVALGAVVVLGERTARLPAQTDDVLSGAAPPPGAAPEEVLDLLKSDLAWLPMPAFLPLSPTVTTREVSFDLTNFGAGTSGPIGAPTLSGSGLSALSIVSSTCPSRLRSGEICAVVVRASADDNGAFETFLSATGAPDGVDLGALSSGHAPSLAFVSGGGRASTSPDPVCRPREPDPEGDGLLCRRDPAPRRHLRPRRRARLLRQRDADARL